MKNFTVFLIITALMVSCSRENFLGLGKMVGETLYSYATQFGAVTKAHLTGDNTFEDTCIEMATDSEGNVYCGGYTAGSFAETGAGGKDALIVKLDKYGKLVWARQLGDVAEGLFGGDFSADEECRGIAVDADGYVYCAGYTTGDMLEVNPGPIGARGDVMVTRLNPDGTIDWIKHFGTTSAIANGGDYAGDDVCSGMGLTKDGQFLYCAGSSTGDFLEVGSGNQDIIVLKLATADGSVSWIRHMGDTTEANVALGITDLDDHDYCMSMTVDPNDDSVYCSGVTQSNMVDTQGGNGDIMAVKFTSAGSIDWMFQLGTGTIINGYVTGNRGGDEYGARIAISPNGNHLYIGGSTESDLAEPAYNTDSVVLKLNPTTGSAVWLRQLGTTTEALNAGWDFTNMDTCYGMASDNSGNVYCTGMTDGPLAGAFGGGMDIFVMKINATNTIQYIKQFGSALTIPGGSPAGGDVCTSLRIDVYNNLVCAGGTTSFGEANSGNTDLFFLRFNTEAEFVWP